MTVLGWCSAFILLQVFNGFFPTHAFANFIIEQGFNITFGWLTQHRHRHLHAIGIQVIRDLILRDFSGLQLQPILQATPLQLIRLDRASGDQALDLLGPALRRVPVGPDRGHATRQGGKNRHAQITLTLAGIWWCRQHLHRSGIHHDDDVRRARVFGRGRAGAVSLLSRHATPGLHIARLDLAGQPAVLLKGRRPGKHPQRQRIGHAKRSNHFTCNPVIIQAHHRCEPNPLSLQVPQDHVLFIEWQVQIGIHEPVVRIPE